MRTSKSPTVTISKLRADQEGFALPADGWIMLLPKGRFPGTLSRKTDTGEETESILQEFDDTAFASMKDAWDKQETAMGSNFPGMLIDFDHFSHDTSKPSEAAGWVTAIEVRPDGIWGLPRWSKEGLEKVQGGAYRLVSPVLTDFEDVGKEGDLRVMRPGTLLRLALTNDPQLKGMPPVSNRAAAKPTVNVNNKDKNMDLRKQLCALLGLAEDCTDEQLIAKITELSGASASRNGCTDKEAGEMRARIQALNAELAANRKNLETATAQLIDHDERRFAKLIPDKEKLRGMLTANREATVAVLTEMEKASEEAAKASAGNGAGRKPMHDSKNRSHPGSPDGTETTCPTDQEAAAIRLRAETIAASSNIGFNRAWDEAIHEWRLKRVAAGVR